jgi:hypothetical protein
MGGAMDASQLGTEVGTLKDVIEILGVLFAGITSVGVLLLSTEPCVYVEELVHWPPGKVSNADMLSAQLLFMNPAAGSQVVSELEPERLIVEQNGRRCSLSAYAILKSMTTSGGQAFEPEVVELIRPTIIFGGGQEAQHVCFLPDTGRHNMSASCPTQATRWSSKRGR